MDEKYSSVEIPKLEKPDEKEHEEVKIEVEGGR